MRKLSTVSLLMLLSACGGAGSGSSGTTSAAQMPPECVSFYEAMSSCNAQGQRATPEEASAQFAAFKQAWTEGGASSATVEQCKSLDATWRASPSC